MTEYKIRIESLDPKEDKHLDFIVVDEDLESLVTEQVATLTRLHFK